jgi:hypothetical protein
MTGLHIAPAKESIHDERRPIDEPTAEFEVGTDSHIAVAYVHATRIKRLGNGVAVEFERADGKSKIINSACAVNASPEGGCHGN